MIQPDLLAAFEPPPDPGIPVGTFRGDLAGLDAAVHFKAYGWVPTVALRWRKADGTVAPWSAGREGDAFLIAREFIR